MPMRWQTETETEVIGAVNAAETGLAACLHNRDIGRVFRVGGALEAGMVGINTGLISTAEVPFGGVKQSGLGREGSGHGITFTHLIGRLLAEVIAGQAARFDAFARLPHYPFPGAGGCACLSPPWAPGTTVFATPWGFDPRPG